MYAKQISFELFPESTTIKTTTTITGGEGCVRGVFDGRVLDDGEYPTARYSPHAHVHFPHARSDGG